MTHYQSPENLTTLPEIFRYDNEVIEGLFAFGVLFSLYVSIFGYLKLRGNEAPDCAFVAGTATAVVAIIFRFFGLISDIQLYITFSLVVVAALLTYFSK